MTKMKSKKMTKSTFAIIIMAVIMVAMLAFGGTYAYFTATTKDTATGEIEIGKVMLTTATNGVTITTQDIVVPGATIIKGNLTYTNASTVETLVAVVMEIKIDGTAIKTLDGKSVSEVLAGYGVSFALQDVWANPTFDEDFGGFVYTLTDCTLADKDKAATVVFNDGDITFNAQEHYDETTGKYTDDKGTEVTSIQGKKLELTFTAYQTQLQYKEGGVEFKEYNDATTVIADMKTALGLGA